MVVSDMDMGVYEGSVFGGSWGIKIARLLSYRSFAAPLSAGHSDDDDLVDDR
jgi:hypothetical protein